MAMLIENHKQTILELMKESEAFLQQIGDQQRAEKVGGFRADIEGRDAPAILFYGLYNAGKSTLINALCRANVAKVGDVPTTQDVQKINWEEYILIDTPGINAQNAHTLVAEENIGQSDLVLFVLDNSDTFDNAVVYQAILDILKTDNPDFIDDIHKKNNINLLKNYFNVLSKREKEIIIKRYGLNNQDEITQKEIADELGISRSYVSRIEKRALTKMLREFLKNKK